MDLDSRKTGLFCVSCIIVVGVLWFLFSLREGEETKAESAPSIVKARRNVTLRPAIERNRNRRSVHSEESLEADLVDWEKRPVQVFQRKGYPETPQLSPRIIEALDLTTDQVSSVKEIMEEHVKQMVQFNSQPSQFAEIPIDRTRTKASVFMLEADAEGSVGRRASFESAIRKAIDPPLSEFLLVKLNPMLDLHPIIRGFGKMKLRVTFADTSSDEPYRIAEVLFSPEGIAVGSHFFQPEELPKRYAMIFKVDESNDGVEGTP